jgi:hypothetical protein
VGGTAGTSSAPLCPPRPSSLAEPDPSPTPRFRRRWKSVAQQKVAFRRTHLARFLSPLLEDRLETLPVATPLHAYQVPKARFREGICLLITVRHHRILSCCILLPAIGDVKLYRTEGIAILSYDVCPPWISAAKYTALAADIPYKKLICC